MNWKRESSKLCMLRWHLRDFFFFPWVINPDGLFIWAQRGRDHLRVWGSPSFLFWAGAQALPCWSLRSFPSSRGICTSTPGQYQHIRRESPSRFYGNIDRGWHITPAALIFKVLGAFQSSTSISSLLNFWCNSLSKGEVPSWRVSTWSVTVAVCMPQDIRAE